jgi:thiamine pyrophosphokinase
MGCPPSWNADATPSSSSNSSSNSRSPLINKDEEEHPQYHTYTSPFLPLQSDNCTDKDKEVDCENVLNDNEGTLHNPQLQPQLHPKHPTVAMIILNSPIANPPSPIFQKLWSLSSFRICADGGANRLYDAVSDDVLHRPLLDGDHRDVHETSYIPDLICGDLDSLEISVKEYYEQRGVDVIQDTNQENNDLDKALCAIRDWKLKMTTNSLVQESIETTIQGYDQGQKDNNDNDDDLQIFVYGAFGGRFDQEMASIQAMYRWRDEFHYRIALYSDETFAILTRPHMINEIYLPFYSKMDVTNKQVSHGEGPTCGLIPIGCRCEGVRTKGFKWNLDGSVPLEFGGLISTSNRAQDHVLQIESPQPLVFTAEVVVVSK